MSRRRVIKEGKNPPPTGARPDPPPAPPKLVIHEPFSGTPREILGAALTAANAGNELMQRENDRLRCERDGVIAVLLECQYQAGDCGGECVDCGEFRDEEKDRNGCAPDCCIAALTGSAPK